MEEVKPLYKGSQETLYAVLPIGWQNCSDNIDLFTKRKDTYTQEYIEASLKAVDIAKKLPNEDARRSQLTRTRTQLTAAAGDCNEICQSLFNYIGGSFPKPEIESMKKLAGSENYGSAAGGNWLSEDTMLTMASTFIDTYAAELKKGKMPDSFAADFADRKATFEAANKNYSDTKIAADKDKNAKTTANNVVYTTFMDMLTDGKIIFKKDAATRKLFSYSGLSKLVTKKGDSGVRVSIKEEKTLLPIKGVSIEFQPGNVIAATDEKGIFKEKLAKGEYTYTILMDGYQKVEGKLKVASGTTRRLNVILKKIVPVAKSK